MAARKTFEVKPGSASAKADQALLASLGLPVIENPDIELDPDIPLMVPGVRVRWIRQNNASKWHEKGLRPVHANSPAIMNPGVFDTTADGIIRKGKSLLYMELEENNQRRAEAIAEASRRQIADVDETYKEIKRMAADATGAKQVGPSADADTIAISRSAADADMRDAVSEVVSERDIEFGENNSPKGASAILADALQ